jgi:thiamine-phosphate pyrophosphorylase
MRNPQLYVVTDPKQSLADTCKTVYGAVRAGTKWIQLRRKHDTSWQLKHLIEAVQGQISAFDVQLIMNDHLDMACQLNLSGVHLGQNDTCVFEARKQLPKGKIVGLTVETWSQLEQAQSYPIDYIGISSVFPTSTKPDIKTVWGLELLQQACEYSKIPLVAIGGIQEDQIYKFKHMNLHSIAVTSAITQKNCAFTATQSMLKQIQSC